MVIEKQYSSLDSSSDCIQPKWVWYGMQLKGEYDFNSNNLILLLDLLVLAF